MRHSATRALLERDDVIIVASVSCIYGIGSVETYGAMTQDLVAGHAYDQRQVIADLVEQQYRRNDHGFQRGTFRVRGDSLELWPAHLEDRAWRLSFFGEELESIQEFDPLTGARTDALHAHPGLRQLALRHAAPDAAAGDQEHPHRAPRPPRPARRRGQAARGAAAGAAHAASTSR